MATDDLTPSQRAAVEHYEGPLLVLAGPGSGKTRVITRRIARLVDRGVSPWEILAITFTNKAAREMAERVERLLPGRRMWVTTFHKFCARLLRERGEAVGLQPNFSIFDTSDQQRLLKQVLHDEDIDATHFPPNKIGWQISQVKNELITPETFKARFEERVGNHMEAVVARVYPKYQQRLIEANAVDFDDLLVHVALLLQEQDDLRAEWDQRFRYILVDEYQDTNRAQYQIVAALSQVFPNLCATGDPDQSIYGWRGAQIENILRFERDFPQVAVIRLEENFRSTPEILRTADALIAHNKQRKVKVLRTDNESGPEVELRLFLNGREEAEGIAADIRRQVEAGDRRWSDFAVFYRVNALSRSLETAMARARVPYQVAAGVAFYERSEVKDLIGYLRIIDNDRDRMAFLRVVNTPPRGIGKTTVDKLMKWADSASVPLLDAARCADQIPGLSKRAVTALQQFAGLIDEFAAKSYGPVAETLVEIVSRIGYQRDNALQSEEDLQRKSNVDELIAAARHYDETGGDEASLGGFLETASLAQDLDALETDLGAVTLMTLHAAKGLEFPCVYIIGVEQNLIPHERSLRNYEPKEIEEERRLLFVGITRAEHHLVMTHTCRRDVHGRELSTIPSDFLNEMPYTNVDCTRGVGTWSQEEESQEVDVDDRLAAPAPKLAALKSMLPKLTTGAALESGNSRSVEIPCGFRVGMAVRHPRYGLGTVIEMSDGYARNRILKVEFADDGRQESFIASKCPLQPVGLR